MTFKRVSTLLVFLLFMPFLVFAAKTPEKVFKAPHGMKISVKEIGPVTQTTDLQIIFVLKHSADGDKYIEAMKDFNEKMGKLLSNLRERGEFVGDIGETLLFTPPPHSITPKKILLIGVGEGKDLSLDKFQLGGRIAVREAVRLQAKRVSFAPALRDQGNSNVEVGEGDGAVAEQVILAYDTEKRLQKQKLAPKFDVKEWVIEAGPKYFDNSVSKVEKAIKSANSQMKERSKKPYVNKG